MSKIYFDTTPIIYFLDDEKPFSDKIANFIYNHQNEDDLYLTSTITDAEYLVFPYRTQSEEKITAYDNFLKDFYFHVIEPNRAVTKTAAKLRAKYKGLKGMDAIHIATSIYYKCDVFLTNDIQLRHVSEVNVLLVDDM